MPSLVSPPPLVTNSRVPFAERLSTRVVLLQAVVIAGVLIVSAWRSHNEQIEEARAALKQTGEILVPFMLPSIRPALDFAIDESTGAIDESLLQNHIVVAVFETAKKNRDLVHADLVLESGRRIGTFTAPEVTPEELDSLFRSAPKHAPVSLSAFEFVAHQAPVLTPDGKTRLGVLRVAHSLTRVRETASRSLTTTLLIGAFIFGLAVVLTLLMGNALIYSPLKALLKSVQGVESGKLVTNLSGRSSGELGLLSHAFEKMTDALRDMVRRIQETSTGLTRGVATIGKCSEASLADSRHQSTALDKISSTIATVDRTSGAVDQALERLMTAANRVASDTSALSKGMTALEPQVGEFSSFVHQTHEAMQKMASAATTIADSVAAMTGATEGVASTVVQFEQSVRLVGASTEKAAALSKDVDRRAAEGQEAVANSVTGMADISNAFAVMATAVDGLGKSVDAIGRALEVITEVTQRTQLLSLNASILAAQAGEQGRAFAVVANEIKALSDRTSTSTADIGETLAKLERAHTLTTEAMAAGSKRVQEGQRLAQNAGDSIGAILTLSGKSHAQIAEIARATQEQIQGSRHITTAVTRIAEMGRTIGAASQDQKSSADSISSLTSQMVTTLAAVEGVIKKEVAASVQTAEQIGRVLEMAAAIREESSAQKTAAIDTVESIAGVRNFAAQMVATAEAVTSEAESLAKQAEALRQSVGHFEIAEGASPTSSVD